MPSCRPLGVRNSTPNHTPSSKSTRPMYLMTPVRKECWNQVLIYTNVLFLVTDTYHQASSDSPLTHDILVEDVVAHLQPVLVFPLLPLGLWRRLQHRWVAPHLLLPSLLRRALYLLLTLTRRDVPAGNEVFYDPELCVNGLFRS